jgi:hypothetical protein
MRLALFVGTSFAVGVTELFLQHAHARGVEAYSVDPGGASAPYPRLTVLTEKAEELLPAVCASLGAALPERGSDPEPL